MNKNNQKNIDIELTEDVAYGIYSNIAVINHSQSEFVVDFIQMMPNVPKAKVKSRIILTPQHAKRFAKVLNGNIKNFEAEHGEILDSEVKIPINFLVPQGEA